MWHLPWQQNFSPRTLPSGSIPEHWAELYGKMQNQIWPVPRAVRVFVAQQAFRGKPALVSWGKQSHDPKNNQDSTCSNKPQLGKKCSSTRLVRAIERHTHLTSCSAFSHKLLFLLALMFSLSFFFFFPFFFLIYSKCRQLSKTADVSQKSYFISDPGL